MKRAFMLLFFSFALTGLPGCRLLMWGAKIPLIGLNKDGQEVVKMVPMKAYSKDMASMINNTTENLSESLRDYGKNSPWELSRVDLNVLITFGFSILDVVGLDIIPGFRLQFVKK